MYLIILGLLASLLTGCVVTHPLPMPPFESQLNVVAHESRWYTWETNQLEVTPHSEWVDHNDTLRHEVSLVPDDTKPRITQVVVMVREYNPQKIALEDFEVSDWSGALQLRMEEISDTETIFTVDLDPNHPGYPQNYPFSLFQITWRALSGQIDQIDYQLRDITYE